MRRAGMCRGGVVVLLALALLVVPASALGRGGKVKRPAPLPPGFVGMVVDGPMWPTTLPGITPAAQFNKMTRDGVENVELTFDWASAQPFGSWAQLRAAGADASAFTNVGGVPTDFRSFDKVVQLAAQRRMTVLPVVLDAPGWDAGPGKGMIIGIPARPGPYAHFVKALVQRYGTHGTFWSAHRAIPKVPIRMWQVWNEPDIPAFWSQQPFAASYVALLRAAHAAVKSADPAAKVVLAGVANFSWRDLAHIYAVRGARSLFDVVAVHPYTKFPKGVITILGKVRRVMDKNGDVRKPMVAGEISWPSSLGQTPHNVGYDFSTTEAGQARNVRAILPLLARNRARLKLLGFDYYTWASVEAHNALAFAFSGLLRYSSGKLDAKPALAAFTQSALKLESCRQKAFVATRCLRPG